MKRALVLPLLALGCAEPAAGTSRAPRDRPEVRAVLTTRCLPCHEGATAAGGWRADSFAASLGCGGATVTSDGGADAPLLRALDRADHRDLLSPAERATVTAWVRGGALPGLAGVHPEGMGDPRSPDFHARTLRAARWSLMLDAGAPNACGRCHDDAPARPAAVTRGSPGATPCSACHAQPQGALACGTCHRVDGAPGATGCVAPQGDPTRGAHAAHLSPRLRAQGLTCATCHPARGADLSAGEHGDGVVQVAFDRSLAGDDARYDRARGTCTVTCHTRGGSDPTPAWRGGAAATCGSCHGAPPADHPPGPCATCHAEANADGTALRANVLHLNGRVDLGRGEGECGACHGRGSDPWPDTGAHAIHREALRSHPVACEHCHTVPATVRAPGHLDGVVQVTLAGDALLRGARATFDRGTCAEVACHGAGLISPAPALRWSTNAPSPGCGGCHGTPPPAPHPAATTCASLLCHGGSVRETPAGLGITASGRATHIDGVVQYGRAP